MKVILHADDDNLYFAARAVRFAKSAPWPADGLKLIEAGGVKFAVKLNKSSITAWQQ